MKIFSHRIFIFSSIAFYGTLMLHDGYLYPHLVWYQVAILSFLRLFLIGVPLLSGILMAHYKNKNWKWALLCVWLFFLPYTIYSITEIRHVAEMCRLLSPVFFTEQCVKESWRLIPTFLYAFVGTLTFVFTVLQVVPLFFQNSCLKRMAVLGLCLYTSIAGVFGLYSRINEWGIFTQPRETILSLIHIFFVDRSFSFNVVVFTLFSMGLVFVTETFFQSHQNKL